VPGHERGRRTDAALAALPPLIAGEPTRLDHEPSRPTLTLAPPAPVPPILVGGSSPAAIRRAATSGDGWFPSLLPPSALPGHTAELRRQAAAHGRPPPSVTVGGHVVLGDDAAARSAHDALVGSLVDDHGLPPEEAAEVPMRGRGPDELAARFASYAEAGAGHLVVSPEGDDWRRQCERIAEARALLQEDRPAARDPASHDPVDPH